MKRLDKNRNGKTRRKLWMLAAAAVATLALAAPVEAGHKHKVKIRHGKHQHKTVVQHVHHPRACSANGCVVHRVRPGFVVPARIHRRALKEYRSYYGGRVFDARLGAYVEVYHFPVRTHRGWVYRPHRYHRGVLITGNHVYYDGPRMSFRINF